MTDAVHRSPRLAKRGDVVIVPIVGGGDVEEVVRGVSVVLHLGNGQDVIVPTNEPIRFVPPEDLSVELREQIEELSEEQSP